MSSGFADVVRELSAALSANDPARWVGFLDPEVVQYGTRGGMDQDRVFRGREAVLGYWNEVAEAWESLTYESERLIEAGDVVVAFWHERGRSRRGDLEVELDTATVFRFEGGKIIELRGYLDRDEALRDAGLTAKSE
jgi:ketosteroid isomerase-like protein